MITDDRPWLHRITAIRASASRMSHAELDEAEEFDRGNPAEPDDHDGEPATMLPDLCFVGGCGCGTDHGHVAHISAALGSSAEKVSVKFALVAGLATGQVPERETANQQVNDCASGSVRRRQ